MNRKEQIAMDNAMKEKCTRSSSDEKSLFDGLCDAMIALRTSEDFRKFLIDICSVKEIEAISQRLRVAQLLRKGMNYQQIIAETGASTVTISRVNRCLKYGSGGYDIVLERSDD